MANTKLTLSVLPKKLAVCRFDKDAEIPDWFNKSNFFSITRTEDELSLVCAEENIPEDVTAEKGWRTFKVEGPLDFALVGILAKISGVLAEAGISIFAISTYDTDYILVKEDKLEKAVSTLRIFCEVM